MTKAEYPSVPEDTDRMPRSVPYIIGNEAAERFSFYGMRTILVVFMTQFLRDRSHQLDLMLEEQFHLFVYPSFGSVDRQAAQANAMTRNGEQRASG